MLYALAALVLLAGIGLIGYAFQDRLVDWWQSRSDDTDDAFDDEQSQDAPAAEASGKAPGRLSKLLRRGRPTGGSGPVGDKPDDLEVPWPTEHGAALPFPDTDVDAEELIDVIKAETSRLEAYRAWLDAELPSEGQGEYVEAVSRLRIIADWADTETFGVAGWDGTVDRVEALASHAAGLLIGDVVQVAPAPFPLLFGSKLPTIGVVAATEANEQVAKIYELLGVARPEITAPESLRVESVAMIESVEEGEDVSGRDIEPSPTPKKARRDTADQQVAFEAEKSSLHLSYGLPDPLPDHQPA